MEENRLPERYFASGHEPSGERVNTYLQAKRIDSILQALDADEVAYLQASPFATILRTAELPPFSGSFGQYLIGKLLNVKKKHEIWFLFAGKPVRFSIREFAIVTGLNCAKLPKKNAKKRKRNPVNEKPYWPELLGTLKVCTVDKAIEMLEKKKVKGKESRLKFACLAIASAVIMPTSHFPKIIPDHVEMIRDLDEFLKYPWGRAAFDVMMVNIKSKDAVALSQSTVAVRGFVHSIQLVIIAAVPALMEEVQTTENESSGESGSESEEEDTHGNSDDSSTVVSRKKKRVSRLGFNPGHARVLDEACKVDVQCIIGGDEIESLREVDLSWSDDDEDEKVETMVRLIEGGFAFKRDMFKGGITTAGLERLRAEKKQKEKEVREAKEKEKLAEVEGEGTEQPPQAGGFTTSFIDHEVVARLVCTELKEDIRAGELRLRSYLEGSLQSMHSTIVEGILKGLREDPTLLANVLGVREMRATPTPTFLPQHVTRPDITIGQTARDSVDVTVNDVLSSLHSSAYQDEAQRIIDSGTEKDLPLEEDGLMDSVGLIDKSGGKGTEDKTNENRSEVTEDQMIIDSGTEKELPLQEDGIRDSAGLIDKSGAKRMEDITNENRPEVSEITEPSLVCPTPSFSLGMSQPDTTVNDVDGTGEADPVKVVPTVDVGKNKRARTTSLRLKDYHSPQPKHQPDHVMELASVTYEEKFTSLKEKAQEIPLLTLGNGKTVQTADIVGLASRTTASTSEVIDALMYFSSLLVIRKWNPTNPRQIKFLDTSFPSAFTQFYVKFSKTAIKDRSRLKYPDHIVDHFQPDGTEDHLPDKLYFPFHIDHRHWVGVCVNIVDGDLHVLDCNTVVRGDALLKKDLGPIANILPYAINAASGGARKVHDKAFAISRVKGVSQNVRYEDSAITSVLLMQAHAIGGVDGCKCITESTLAEEARKVAVMFFEEFGQAI